MDELVHKVWQWFDDHDLWDPKMQFVKMIEETGELAHEITRNRTDSVATEDALGDILVTVIGMCHHLGYDPRDCLDLAYNEIKDRKGKTINGSFVKNE